MNLLLGVSLLLAFFVLFIQLCKLDMRHPVHLLSVLLRMFGVVMVYGFTFERGLIDYELFKAGIVAFLFGSSIWFMADRRRL